MTYSKIVGASALALALAVPVALSPMLASPAHAQFGFGRIVYDRNRHGAEGRTFRATPGVGLPATGRSPARNPAPLPAARRGGGE